ncbi:MAG: hypothetical protein WCO10_03070 [bacterium]
MKKSIIVVSVLVLFTAILVAVATRQVVRNSVMDSKIYQRIAEGAVQDYRVIQAVEQRNCVGVKIISRKDSAIVSKRGWPNKATLYKVIASQKMSAKQGDWKDSEFSVYCPCRTSSRVIVVDCNNNEI